METETVDFFGSQVAVLSGTCSVCDEEGRVIEASSGLVCANPVVCLYRAMPDVFGVTSDQIKASIAKFGE